MSTTTLNPTADSYVRDGTYASTNYGSASDLQVKYSSTSGQGYNRIAFLEFDLASVSSIGEAVVKLYGNVNNSDVLSIGAYPIASPTWGQNTITWNNQPSPGTLLNTTTVSGTSDNWFSWDLTGYLQAQKAAGHDIVSIALIGTTSTGGYSDFDAVESGSNEPQLIIASDDASLTPTNDAYVQDSTSDNTNFGSSTSLLTKKTTGVNNRNIYVTYDTSGVTGTVSNAYLQFTGGIASGGTDTNVAVNVYGVSTTTWSEGTITWNNAPSAGGTVLASNSVIDTTTRVYTFDVSSYVNAQRADGHDVVSFMIQAGAVTSSSIIDFNSKEASSGKPALVLSESGPSVATPAAATPSTVTGTTTSLSVLGADPDGESSLTYTWWTVSQPTGGDVSVSATGTNAAKDVTAYFDEPGTYAMYAVITDPEENSISSNTLTFTVVSTLASIAVTPTPASMNENATQQFSASGLDQFGVALTTQPAFTWTNSGAGSVSSTGLYTAPGSTGSATVTATSGSVSGSASVTVSNAAPTVATAAAASPSPVTGTTASLSALGADDGGESNLTYTWTTTSIPSGATAPTYSTNDSNSAKNDTATFTSAGAYTFMVTITDLGGLYVTSSVSVTVNQTPTSISVTPGGPVTLGSLGTQQFAATALDQFGVALATQPTFTWSNSGAGSIDSTGLYTAPAAAGSDTVTATSGIVGGDASVTIGGPSVATAASATTDPDSGIVGLDVLGDDPNGESTLTYTWSVTSAPSGAPTVEFADNATNTAKDTVAQVGLAGSYTFEVSISDGTNSAISDVTVSESQTPTELMIDQAGAALANSVTGSPSTADFTATELDQFGSTITSPSLTWSVAGGGVGGSIDSSGVYTAPTSGTGADTVTVTDGSLSDSTQTAVGFAAGTVVDDVADDGDPAGDLGLSGWTVYEETNGDPGTDVSTTTDANGNYDLPQPTGSGETVVHLSAPTGWATTFPSCGCGNYILGAAAAAGLVLAAGLAPSYGLSIAPDMSSYQVPESHTFTVTATVTALPGTGTAVDGIPVTLQVTGTPAGSVTITPGGNGKTDSAGKETFTLQALTPTTAGHPLTITVSGAGVSGSAQLIIDPITLSLDPTPPLTLTAAAGAGHSVNLIAAAIDTTLNASVDGVQLWNKGVPGGVFLGVVGNPNPDPADQITANGGEVTYPLSGTIAGQGGIMDFYVKTDPIKTWTMANITVI